MILEPQRVQPGWAKRWWKQGLALYARNPIFPMAYLVVLGLSSEMFTKCGIPMMFFMMVFCLAVGYVGLKVIDEYGSPFHTGFYHLLWVSGKDIFGMLKGALIFSLAMVVISFLLNEVGWFRILGNLGVKSGASQSTPYVLPVWENRLYDGLLCATLYLTIFDNLLFAVYAALLIGYDYALNHIMGKLAFSRNVRIFGFLYFGSFVLLGITMLLYGLDNAWMYWLGLLIVCGLLLAWLMVGYLASREIFEGRLENQRQESSAKQQQPEVFPTGI
ncbi:hypothetical protein ACJU26_08815 [Acidithiobacillus sp. M4-SHS-6]|uniref:hypothetical protein n=1 Tax=Acidithiobacillus sp. M4-SHS-6 TaxID=3383024 RepID=UPI0039BEB808